MTVWDMILVRYQQQPLTQKRINFFEIIKREQVDISDWHTNFFLGGLGGPIFLRYNVTTTNSLGFQFR